MRKRFMEFVASRGHLLPAQAYALMRGRERFHELVGAIALGHELITLDQLEEVLSRLTRDERFGEVAVRLGYLTEEQVQRLLAIQELQEAVEIGESLILHGYLDRPALLKELTAFFTGVAAPAPA